MIKPKQKKKDEGNVQNKIRLEKITKNHKEDGEKEKQKRKKNRGGWSTLHQAKPMQEKVYTIYTLIFYHRLFK
jgi:hypothetical protein